MVGSCGSFSAKACSPDIDDDKETRARAVPTTKASERVIIADDLIFVSFFDGNELLTFEFGPHFAMSTSVVNLNEYLGMKE